MARTPTGIERPRRNRKRSQQVRVADIAQAVGVSGATVSRALARTGAVSEPLQRQIEAAARELGYVPNGAARALASRKSRAIGAIIPTLENLSFASGAEAMQRCVIEAGYSFLVASTGYDPAREFAQVRAFAAHGVDGIMLVGGARDAAVTDFLHGQKIPYVITWTFAEAPDAQRGLRQPRGGTAADLASARSRPSPDRRRRRADLSQRPCRLPGRRNPQGPCRTRPGLAAGASAGASLSDCRGPAGATRPDRDRTSRPRQSSAATISSPSGR